MLCEIKLPALYRLFILMSSEDWELPMAASLSAALQNLETGPHPNSRGNIHCVCLAVYPSFVSKGRPRSPCRLHCCDCSRLFLLGLILSAFSTAAVEAFSNEPLCWASFLFSFLYRRSLGRVWWSTFRLTLWWISAPPWMGMLTMG